MFKVSKNKTHYNNVSNIFKVNNKDTRTASGTSIVTFENFALYSTVIIVEFDQINNV